MKKNKIIITFAAMLAVSSLMVAPGSPATIQVSADYSCNENFTGTWEDVQNSVSPVGTIIKDEYSNLKYRVIEPYSPSYGYIDKWTGKYMLNLDSIPGHVEVVGHINPKKQSEYGTRIDIGQTIWGEIINGPKTADGQYQDFIVTGIAKNAFKNDCEDLFVISDFSIPSGGVYIDKLVIPDGAFKNCKKLKKVGISLSECSEVEFTGKAFENAPISEFNVVNGHSDFYNPIKWTVKKNTFKKVKSGNIKVEYIMNDLASKNDIKKNSKNIRSALSKGGIKKSKIQVRYQYNGKMRKLK